MAENNDPDQNKLSHSLLIFDFALQHFTFSKAHNFPSENFLLYWYKFLTNKIKYYEV